jgi:hypothetical protein
MKRYLPGRVELAMLAAMALVCTVVAGLIESRDVALAFLTVPVFFTASILGLRKNWRFQDLARQSTPDAE